MIISTKKPAKCAKFATRKKTRGKVPRKKRYKSLNLIQIDFAMVEWVFGVKNYFVHECLEICLKIAWNVNWIITETCK